MDRVLQAAFDEFVHEAPDLREQRRMMRQRLPETFARQDARPDFRDHAAQPADIGIAREQLQQLQLALGKVIRAMGVKEFATKVRMASPNVLRAINPRHNPTQDTLNRLLKPFKLRLSLAPLARKTRPNAA